MNIVKLFKILFDILSSFGFAVIMLVSGNWNAIAKLEDLLPRLEQKLDLTIGSRRTQLRGP